jgi:hypothetical protein
MVEFKLEIWVQKGRFRSASFAGNQHFGRFLLCVSARYLIKSGAQFDAEFANFIGMLGNVMAVV